MNMLYINVCCEINPSTHLTSRSKNLFVYKTLEKKKKKKKKFLKFHWQTESFFNNYTKLGQQKPKHNNFPLSLRKKQKKIKKFKSSKKLLIKRKNINIIFIIFKN